MSLILNNYKKKLPYLKMNNSEYYDFVLSKDGVSYGYGNNSMSFSMNYSCENDDGITLPFNSEKFWSGSVNDGVIISDIGFTGIDNGLVLFDRLSITNNDFVKLITNSVLEIDSDEKNIRFNKVGGNVGLYSYEIGKNCDDNTLVLKGGFYQGFFKACQYNYQLFPTDLNCGWTIELEVKPKDYETKENILNKTHFDTDGFIFYVGTRAENKFCQFYDCDLTIYEDRILPDWLKDLQSCNSYDYFIETDEWKPEFFENECGCDNKGQKKPLKKEKLRLTAYDYMFITYYNNKFLNNDFCGCIKPIEKEPECECENDICNNGNYLIDNDYIIKDEKIDCDSIKTSEGNSINNPTSLKVKTDNKYLIFDRTKNGYTVKTWNDNDIMEIEYQKREFSENPFLIYNRTKTGITVNRKCNESVLSYFQNKEKYDIVSDITENAFGIRIREDGSIGYRYIVGDCESETKFKIEEEYGFSGAIKKDEWNFITIKLINASCPTTNNSDKMKVMIYVNGMLKFVSKELPLLRLRALNESYDKQRGVPFNMSVGGGTMGLAESILCDIEKPFTKILPIEKYFAGSFIGDLKTFNLYSDQIDFAQINTNYKYSIIKV